MFVARTPSIFRRLPSGFVASVALALALAPALGLTLALLPSSAAAQETLAYNDRAPRFVTFADGEERPLDVRHNAVLNRRIALDLDGVTPKEALAEIVAQSALRLVYRDVLLPTEANVHLRATDITVAAALGAVLMDAGVDVAFDRSGGAVLVRRGVRSVAPTGAVAGRVTDKKTGAALSGATVSVDGTSRSTTAGTDGRYRITQVAPGTYTVRARYIGCTASTASVTVTADQDAAADFSLEKSVQRLDEVVTTGTVVPTEVKALPSPITVITAEDIALQHPRRFDELLQLAVPGAVVSEPDGALDPTVQTISIRGQSSFSSAQNNPKIYIDGIETSERFFQSIDPSNIERVEVVRGPQASALYGSDAMGGVIQIFTKRGAQAGRRPEIEALAALGRIESAFPNNSGALRQEYNAALSGRTNSGRFHVGTSYRSTGDWMPLIRERTPGVQGAIQYEQGPLTVDLSGRYEQAESRGGFNTFRLATGSPFVDPFPTYIRTRARFETYALRLGYQATKSWQHTITVGLDQHAGPYDEYQRGLRTPDDTLLFAGTTQTRKLSYAYHTSLTAALTPGLTGTLTAGADHYLFTWGGYGAYGAITTTPLVLDPVQGGVSAFDMRATNSGVFVQAQLNLREALFVTGSVRAEDNSEFGSSLSWPRSTRAGLTYVRDLGSITVKLRTSYGEAIRAPTFGAKDSTFAQYSGYTFIQLPNPGLRAERQHGPDGGIDLVINRRGTLSITYYNQTAKDFVGGRQLPSAATTIITQYINLGRVRNVGWEFEGALTLPWVTARGNFAITHTRPEDLGDYPENPLARVRQQFGSMPVHTGGLMLTANPLPTTSLTAGVIYQGGALSFDGLAYYRCTGNSGPCKPSIDDYYTNYPGIVKLNLSLDQRVNRWVNGYVSVEDVTNTGLKRSLADNTAALPGRIGTVGVRLHY